MTTVSEAITNKLRDPIDVAGIEDSVIWPEDVGIQNDELGEEILVTPELVPEDHENMRPLIVRKVDSTSLNIDNVLQHFSPAETRSLNVLLLNRETPIKSRLIQEITETNKSLVARSLKGLAKKLTTSYGVTLIVRNDDATYTIHPALKIVESTNKEEAVPLATMRQKLLGDFVAAQTVDDPMAQAVLRRYGSTTADTKWSKKYVQLKSKDIEPLFDQFDRGAIQYQQGNDISDKIVTEGLIAWHKIFYSGLGFARSFAFSYIRKGGQEGNTDTYDEYFQIGAVALWNATLTFDKEKASFAHYAMLRVHSSIGHHVTNERRHRHLSTASMLRKQDKDDRTYTSGERTKAILAAEAASVVDPIQLSIAQMTQRKLVRRLFEHELLRPSEALVLSLSYGIHSESLDGLQLDTPTGKLIYTEDLKKNELFMQGLSIVQIAEMLGLTAKQVGRIHHQALQKAHDIILTDLYTRADREEFARSGMDIFFE